MPHFDFNPISHNYISTDGFNRKLYASTKINNENLIYNFCSKNNVLEMLENTEKFENESEGESSHIESSSKLSRFNDFIIFQIFNLLIFIKFATTYYLTVFPTKSLSKCTYGMFSFSEFRPTLFPSTLIFYKNS